MACTLCLAPWPCEFNTPCFLLPCWCVLVINELTSYILLPHRRCVCWMDYRELLCESSPDFLACRLFVRLACVWLILFSYPRVFNDKLTHFLSLVTNSLQRAYHIPFLSSMIPNHVLCSSTLLSSRLLVHKKRVVSSPWNFGSLGIYVLGWCLSMTPSLNVMTSPPPIATDGPQRVPGTSDLPQSSISPGLLSTLTAGWTMGGQSGEGCSSSAVVR